MHNLSRQIRTMLFFSSKRIYRNTLGYLDHIKLMGLRVSISFFSFMILSVGYGQVFVINNGQDQTCSGAFLDSGGQGGSGYSNNENFTYVLCPDNPGDAISVNFITFGLSTLGTAPVDNLVIYDGNSITAPLIGTYTGTSLQGQVISASFANSSGCLTFVWNSNATGLGIFAGSITCYIPCAPPTATADMGQSIPALICQGESVDFDASASQAALGFNIVSYNWDFDDGTTTTTAGPFISHQFTDPGEYVVQLEVIDDNGCSSTNLTDLAIWVSTTPSFHGTSGDLVGCLGEELCLTGIVNGTLWSELPDANFGTGIYLPDNVGSCFTSALQFTQFAPGQTLTNINQLGQICLEMEHSFMGDLVISIISPTGQTVILHQQGGGSTFLGDANDGDGANPIPGTCWTYCFDPLAINGTWVDNSQSGATPNVVTVSQGSALAPGTYESLQPLSGLVGSQLNGAWTIEICDLWGSDNGFLCGWSIDFDPVLFPDLTEFTPEFGLGCDSTYWTGPNITNSSPNCNEICITPNMIGTYDYVFSATDDFGCTYDTTLQITITPGPVVEAGPNQTICNDSLQLSASILNLPPPPTPTYLYSWSPITGLSDPNISDPLIHSTTSTMYYVTAWEQGHPDCAHTDSLLIDIDPTIDPGEDTLAIVCASDPLFDLIDMLGGTPDPGGLWNDTLGNPVANTYDPSNQTDGIFIYTVTSILGCVGSAILEIEVLPLGHPMCCGIPDAGPDDISCDLSYTFNASAGNPNVGLWSGPAGAIFSDISDTNAVVTMDFGGTYMFYWIEDDNLTCLITDSVTITFSEQIYSNLTTTNPVCYNYCDGNVQAAAIGGNVVGSYTYNWSNGIAGISDNNATALCDGTYTVTVMDDNNCSVDTTFIINEPPPMTIDTIDVTNETCFGECDGQIEIIASTAIQYSFDGGNTFSQTNSIVDQCTSTWNVVVQDIDGCEALVTATIDGPPEVEAEFSHTPQPSNVIDPSVSFLNNSTGAISYIWDFAGLGTSIDYQPIFEFPNSGPGEYEVCLIASNINGCSDEFCQLVVVEDELLIYIPNSFTPNGDGTNDRFGPSFSIEVGEYNMLVFDRWGSIIFETNDPNDYWTGSYKNKSGNAVQEGAYAWRIRVKDINTGLNKELFGHVTLLK